MSATLFGDAPLARGDRVPDFLLPDREGACKFLYVEARGKPIVVFLARSLAEPRVRSRLAGFARFAAGDDRGGGQGGRECAHCFAITEESAATVDSLAEARAFPGVVLIDHHGVSAQAFGVPWDRLGVRSLTYVLDPNQRVLAVYDDACDDPAARAFDLVAGLTLYGETLQPRDLAPVLMIPRVFEPAFCRRLIDACAERGLRETGTTAVRDGKRLNVINHDMKKRFDYIIDDRALLEEIHWRFARRVTPEIQKAFRYHVAEAEGFRVACYRAADHGYFRAHRDNVSPAVAHRCFAFSLNLNSEEYDGGGLRFAEYGEHVYKPATGEVIVFSCSLLHEAMDVTAGDRYVLLGFLLGAEGVREREVLRRQAGPEAGAS